MIFFLSFFLVLASPILIFTAVLRNRRLDRAAADVDTDLEEEELLAANTGISHGRDRHYFRVYLSEHL
jgi:hypothetical protein